MNYCVATLCSSLETMKTHPKNEQSLIIMKPDAIQRNLVGEIIGRFERKGVKINGIKMMTLEDAMLEAHYIHIADKPFFAGIKSFMKSSPVVVMALSGIAAVSAIRTIVGPTAANEAPAGTIRGDLAMSIQSNVVHASEDIEAGISEVARFFTEEELFSYEKIDQHLVYSDNQE
jgi:nucleoside-diphosphate kinase